MCVVGVFLLCLEEQNGAVPKVEVDEVFRLCNLDGVVSRRSGKLSSQSSNSPCVTKLPKFLPTTQCHVAPLRESNCDVVSDANDEKTMGCADLFLDVLGDVLESVSACSIHRNEHSSRVSLTFSTWYLSIASIAEKSVVRLNPARPGGFPYQLQQPLVACPPSIV